MKLEQNLFAPNAVCRHIYALRQWVGEIDPRRSISPSFYKQLLHPQISKAQKRQCIKQQLFALLGPACVKAVRKHVDEIDPWRSM